MIPLEEARRYVFERVSVLPPTTVPVPDCPGGVLAEPVVSPVAIPPFANTAMDGFAVRAEDTAGAGAGPVRLRIVGTVAAGDAELPEVGHGEAARIMTGAPMPPGADGIVMVERTSTDGDTVTVEAEIDSGQHVRGVGEDLAAGDEVLAPGTPLRPAHVGLLTTIGRAEVSVRRPPTVGVLSTGDELIDVDAEPAPGQIRDSNRPALLATLAAAGVPVVDLGRAADDEDEIERALRDGAARCDAVLSSGGVSMGDYDYVKAVLDRIADMRWMQIAIKPAKPFAFGLLDGCPVFGLPGNPVSSVVSHELLARPALRRMQGHPRPDRPVHRARAAAPLRRRPDGKTHFPRVVAIVDDDGGLAVRSAGGQGSHQFSAMAAANALAVLPDGDGVDAGDPVDVLLLDEAVPADRAG